MSEENERRKVQRKEKKDADAAQKAKKKADSVAKEAMEKAELLPLHTAHVLKFEERAGEIERPELVAEMKKEFKALYLKKLMYYLYGVKSNTMKKAELVGLFADKVIE